MCTTSTVATSYLVEKLHTCSKDLLFDCTKENTREQMQTDFHQMVVLRLHELQTLTDAVDIVICQVSQVLCAE